MFSDEQLIEHIRGLQQDLRVINAKHDELLPKISGVYDVLTEDAVKRFQRRFGLPITGKTDLTTWDKIVHESNLIRSKNSLPLAVRVFPNAMYVVSLGDTGRFIYILQGILNGLAIEFPYLPKIDYTGVYDCNTEQAIKILQKNSGLPPTGKLDAATWNSISFLYSNIAVSLED